MQQYRQGDILIEYVDHIPATAKRRAQSDIIVLAQGEATGHAHTIDGADAVAFDDGLVTFLEIRAAMTMLRHQEHDIFPLPRGNARVIRQREYAPEAPRQVAD